MGRFSPLFLVLAMLIAACSPDSSTSSKTKTVKEEKEKWGGKGPPPPCHPGCFPAGTMIATPDGPRRIEDIRDGDLVTLVGPGGAATSGKVESSFQTCNRLVEVRTESGNLLTTETQPLCLQAGGFRRAGELGEGDVIWRWEKGDRQNVRVQAVVPTGREEAVFNLVVGESAVFVAGGFLARGKPPALAAESPEQAR
jgi:hypothetical protein